MQAVAYAHAKRFLSASGFTVVGANATDPQKHGNALMQFVSVDVDQRSLDRVRHTALLEVTVYSRSRTDDEELAGLTDQVMDALLGVASTDGNYAILRYPAGITFESLSGGTRAATIQCTMVWNESLNRVKEV